MRIGETANVASSGNPFSRGRMRSALADWMVNTNCSHALTLATNRCGSVSNITRMFGDFCFDLDRACFGKKNVGKIPRGDRLFAIAFIEHPESNIHLHVGLRLDGWWRDKTGRDIADCVNAIWTKISGGSGSTYLRELEDIGWGWYITKEARVERGEYLLAASYHPSH